VNAPRMLFLGSFPPRECGIATFTKDVVDSYDQRFGGHSEIIAIEEPGAPARDYPATVVANLIQADRESYRAVADIVNHHPCDGLNVQHEFGLFGGDNGEWIVDLIALVRKPVTVSLHTVLPEPTPDHLRVVRTICATASAVVVLSATGRDILIDRQVISTFGLINRGKGLEYAIEAMRDVATAHPEALYLILGQTHPVVRRNEGEVYRESLEKLVAEYGLENNVRLVDRYLGFDELVQYLQATDIYLTPYLNPVQIVSGTLAYAVGLGKAVVSTPYLYAEELLAHGRGFLVQFRDAESIANTMNSLLGDRDLRASTERRAYRFGRQMTWPHVAQEYGSLFASLLPNRRTALATSA
jgi:polysaccharide biosynthesis protein PslF